MNDILKKKRSSSRVELEEQREEFKHPSLHQLFLSCNGHPRSIFDGIPRAIQKNPTLLETPNQKAISDARGHIISECKFYDLDDNYIEQMLVDWFSFQQMDLGKITGLKNEGLLLTMSGSSNEEVTLPFSLLVQDWAIRCSALSGMAYHLQQIYAADAILGSDTEKMMEPVMYHYEAVLRIAQNNEEYELKTYYLTQFICRLFDLKLVSAPLSKVVRVVRFMQDFCDIDELVLLKFEIEGSPFQIEIVKDRETSTKENALKRRKDEETSTGDFEELLKKKKIATVETSKIQCREFE